MNTLKMQINAVKDKYATVKATFVLSFVVCQGANLWTFDRITATVDAFTVDRYIDPSQPFHLVVNLSTTTASGTVDKSVGQAFDWAGVKRIFTEVYSD